MENLINNEEMVKEVTNSKKQFQPSNEWFEEYRKSSIDCYIMDRIKDLIIESKFEIIECLSDNDFLWGNFPNYSKREIEKYIKKEYNKDSVFINKLKKLIKSEDYSYENNSEEEKDWIDEFLF
jgi:mannose-1-phosphate guanylyltransferase